MRKLGLVLLVVAAACGGGSSTGGPDAANPDTAAGPPDATPTVTVDDICGTDGVYAKLVAKILQCNPGFDLLITQGQATPAAISAFCHGATDPYRPASIDLPSYAELQACLQYISSTSCLDLNFNDPACNVLHGKVADTMGCDSTEQCLDASYCQRASLASCGTCTPREADGMPCTADEQCANGACVGTQCGHLGVDGDPCFQNGSDCLGTRVCDPSTSKCVTKTWQLNDACSGQGDLGSCGILETDLYCKPTTGTIGNPGQCAHFLAIGDTCDPNNLGAGGLCDIRAYDWCNPNAAGGPKCAAPNVVQEGKQCGMLFGNQCATGLACTHPLGGVQGTCYTPGAKDAACGQQGDPACGYFLFCDNNQCEYTDNTPACP